MHSPREERSFGGGDALDVGDRDAGIEAPSHSNVDIDVVEHDVREPWTEPDRTHETAVPSAVVDLEPALDGGALTSGMCRTYRAPSPASGRCGRSGVVVAAARWWFSHNRIMFHMTPDEPAQLAMARLISGGLRWNMFDHSTWRPGMACAARSVVLVHRRHVDDRPRRAADRRRPRRDRGGHPGSIWRPG